jgi:hypothetical protein
MVKSPAAWSCLRVAFQSPSCASILARLASRDMAFSFCWKSCFAEHGARQAHHLPGLMVHAPGGDIPSGALNLMAY